MRYSTLSLPILILYLNYAFGFISNSSQPQCYDDIPYPEPVLADRIHVVSSVETDLQYNTVEVYGRAGTEATRKIPIDWPYRTCLVLLDAEFEDSTDKFALKSLMPDIIETERTCIEKRTEGQKNGGVIPVGNDKGFYILVQYNPDYSVNTLHLPNQNTSIAGTQDVGN